MLFMDYRTDYVDRASLSPEEARGLDDTPTFLYAMPMGAAPNGRRRIFFEEVSEVPRPACVRCLQRSAAAVVCATCCGFVLWAFDDPQQRVQPLGSGTLRQRTLLSSTHPPVIFCREEARPNLFKTRTH